MTSSSIVSTYRCYLRQIRRLPIPYLRQFYQLKAADDIRTASRSSTDKKRSNSFKRIKQALRRMEAANNGSSQAFQHVLEGAYGRKGKLKRELMESLLSDPKAPVPPRIIPQVESSRPPVYSPEMRALVTSSVSYRMKPLNQKSLDNPPTLPSRADPTSEEARLLGPLSKRREVNLRWRYFTSVCDKTLPPLKIIDDCTVTGPTPLSALHLWGEEVHDTVERLVNPDVARKPLTRRERRQGKSPLQTTEGYVARHHSRWLRRRFQELLASLPILKYSPPIRKETQPTCSVTGSPARIIRSDPTSPHLIRDLGPSDAMSWLERARYHSK